MKSISSGGTNTLANFLIFYKHLKITAMLKRLKTVSMMLFLLGTSTGAAFAVTPSGADDVKITQQSGTATGTVVDAWVRLSVLLL